MARFLQRAVDFLIDRNRPELPAEAIPASWFAILDQHVPVAARLETADRTRLLKLAQLLISEVPFEGCAGLEISEEMRVAIAATACILLLRMPYPRFLKLRRVMVYPDTFVAKRPPSRGMHIEEEEGDALAGEAWVDGIVVLSWAGVLRDLEQRGSGHNVVLHEFAHVLDHEDGYSDGVPILDGAGTAEEWSRVARDGVERHRAAIANDEPAPLRDYAATNRAEFFAVATEMFFEDPEHVREQLPDVYAQLRQYYRQDPAATP